MQAYLDITVDGKPFGRVVIEMYGDVQTGAQRFLDIASGKEKGVDFKRSKFELISEQASATCSTC